MDLPNGGVQLLGDEDKLGSVGRRGGVTPYPQSFEGQPGGSPGGAVYPEPTRSEIVQVGVLLFTDVIRAVFVHRYLHAGDRSETRNEFGFPLELCKSGGKELEVICKANVRRSALFVVGFPLTKADVGVVVVEYR